MFSSFQEIWFKMASQNYTPNLQLEGFGQNPDGLSAKYLDSL